MASLSVLSLAGRDFGCSWQQGLAQEASLADEGRVPCEAALQFDKGKTEAVLPYKECSVEMTVTLQTVTCQFQVDPYQGVQTTADSSGDWVPFSSSIQCGYTNICPQSTLSTHQIPTSSS